MKTRRTQLLVLCIVAILSSAHAVSPVADSMLAHRSSYLEVDEAATEVPTYYPTYVCNYWDWSCRFETVNITVASLEVLSNFNDGTSVFHINDEVYIYVTLSDFFMYQYTSEDIPCYPTLTVYVGTTSIEASMYYWWSGYEGYSNSGFLFYFTVTDAITSNGNITIKNATTAFNIPTCLSEYLLTSQLSRINPDLTSLVPLMVTANNEVPSVSFVLKEVVLSSMYLYGASSDSSNPAVFSINNNIYVIATVVDNDGNTASAGKFDPDTNCSAILYLNIPDGTTDPLTKKKNYRYASLFNRTQFDAISQFTDSSGTSTSVLQDYEIVFTITIPSGANTPTNTFLNPANNTKGNITTVSACKFGTSTTKFFGLVGQSSGISFTALTDAATYGVVDTKTATIYDATSNVANTSVTLGDTVDLMVTFSRAVTYDKSTGTPTIRLNTGGDAKLIDTPTSFTDDKTLIFRYTVGTGDATPTGKYLDAASSTSFKFNGGMIYDTVTMLAVDTTVTLPAITKAKIKVVRSGQRIPPADYDPLVLPGFTAVSSESSRRRHLLLSSGDYDGYDITPTEVSVTVQFNGIYEVSEKSQTFKADLLLIQEWFDARFNLSDKLNRVTEDSGSKLSSVWNPQLTFTNIRDTPKDFDTKLYMYNTGKMQLWRRYIATFYSKVNARAFPFDTQVFQVSVRSTTYDSSLLTFTTIDPTTQEDELESLVDSQFSFSGYEQSTKTYTEGVLKDYMVLTTSIQAKRLATYNAINILFPLSLIMFAVIISYFMPLKSDGRVSMCMSAIAATLAFSFVLANYTPPVNYITRMGLFIFMAYIFGLSSLVVQIVIRMFYNITEDMRAAIVQAEREGRSSTRAASKKLPQSQSEAGSVGPDNVVVNVKQQLTDDKQFYMFFGLVKLDKYSRERYLNNLTKFNTGCRVFYICMFIIFAPLILAAYK